MKLMNTVITTSVLWTIVLLVSSRLNLSINLYKMELSPKLNILGRWKGKHSQGGHTGETDTPWHTQDGGHLAMNLERGTWGQGASLPMVLVTITPLLSLLPLRLSHSEEVLAALPHGFKSLCKDHHPQTANSNSQPHPHTGPSW